MWPFRKKRDPWADLPPLADQARAQLDALREQMNAMAQRDIDRIAATPMPAIFWTPVMNEYGMIVALAWKNDSETALRLLEEPAEGRA